MRVRIGAGKTAGTVAAPPSKSDVHRLLIAAALCAGEQTVIRGFYPSRDIEATVACLCAMGAEISVCGQDCTVRGMPREKKGGEMCLPCGESGSTLRFLLPLCMREDGTALLCGSKTLLSRPLAVYESIAKEQGLRFECVGDTALRVGGALCVNGCAADGGISSQFFSGLCFRAAADGGKSEIFVTRPLQSAAYLQMTAQVLARFGVLVKIDAEKITVQGALHSPGECTAQGDWSGAAFFKVLNAFGGDVRVTGLAPDSLQPDRAIQALWNRVPLRADLSGCPDLGPVLFALAAYRGYGEFTGTRRLRYKESDRIETMREELAAFGAEFDAEEDRVTIRCARFHAPRRVLSGHNDHRVVMALSVLCTVCGGEIEGAEAVAKSMPDFFEKLRALGGKADEIDS